VAGGAAWRRRIPWLEAGPLLALLILATLGPAHAENVPLHTVPTPVLDAVRARFKDARITGASKEREAGQLVYEIGIRHQNRHIDVTLTPEGAILLIEREIAARDLPPPVTRALEERYPNAVYKAVEENITVQGTKETLAH